MIWLGADPGGAYSFGVAILQENGTFDTATVSYVDEAINWLQQEPSGAAIDAPLWWSSGQSGDRKADKFLRRRYRIAAGTVQAANSLRGAVLVQGVMLAIRLRDRFPSLPITEAHPKALLRALGLNEANSWPKLAERFGLKGESPETADERDGLLGAVAAREGFLGRWPHNLASDRFPEEQDPEDPAKGPHAPIVYWWPDV
jgi:predicted nuclease with RNAse H fold